MLPFRVDYIKTMDAEPDIDDKGVWDIDREKAYMAPRRIELVTRYILEHFDKKTYRGNKTYLFNALANTVDVDQDTATNMTFSLDGETVGTFDHVPSSSTEFQYNVPVYTNQSLENMQHELVIEARNGPQPSLILFDYIIYTFMDESNVPLQQGPQSTSSSSQAPPSGLVLSSDVSATFTPLRKTLSV